MGAGEHPWLAPVASGPISADLGIPGSKSVTNRALVLAALSDAPSVITGALSARDTNLMIEALRTLGTTVEQSADGTQIEVTPHPLSGPGHIDCGLAGTVMRFLPPVAALANGDIRFDGDPRARVRPMGAVIEALEDVVEALVTYTPAPPDVPLVWERMVVPTGTPVPGARHRWPSGG